MKKLLSAFIILLSIATASAQQNIDAAGLKQLRFYEDSLKVISKRIMNGESETERKNASYTFIKTLVSALKTPYAYQYPFDSLKSISIVNAPDNHFRILTWHVLNSNGTYQYYGAIQINAVEKLQLFPLEDYTDYLANPEDSVGDNRKWLGARYYKIIQPDAAIPNYTLLGWKGNSSASTKKVIDVLSFSNGKPVFGLPIFDGNGKTRKRVVFEYAKNAAMMLKYIPESHMIVFDHLSPSDSKTTSKFETYGPDMTYSGYRYKQGRWVFTDNLDLRNVANSKDESLTDPRSQQ